MNFNFSIKIMVILLLWMSRFFFLGTRNMLEVNWIMKNNADHSKLCKFHLSHRNRFFCCWKSRFFSIKIMLIKSMCCFRWLSDFELHWIIIRVNDMNSSDKNVNDMLISWLFYWIVNCAFLSSAFPSARMLISSCQS